LRLCSEPGCGRAIPDSARYCAECKQDSTPKQTGADRDRYRDRYDSPEWRLLRPRMMSRDPVCRCPASGLYDGCECGGMCDRLTRVIDHEVPASHAIAECAAARGDDGRLLWPFNKFAGFYLQCNLRGLCDRCHAHKTMNDKSHVGPWPSVVAAWRVWCAERKK